MTVLTPESSSLGAFYSYYIMPGLTAVYFGIIAPVYFYKVHSNTTLAIGFLLLFLVAFVVSYADPFIDSLYFSPNIMDDFNGVMLYNIAISVPFSVIFFAWLKVPWFSDIFLKMMPYYVMIGFQSYRICGLGYLEIVRRGLNEDFFFLWVGTLDLIVSLTAIPLALAVKKNGLKKMKNWVLAWTLMGFGDVTISFVLYFLNWLKLYHADNSLAVLMVYPVSGIMPTFVVGVFFTHLVFLLNMDALMDAKINAPEGDDSESVSESTSLL
mmetsp:Transcript_5132/g.7238  ORF Transcript_5132/g.7238 Transcript_5132/m.7238 type:complete len:268 (+) Transcript_5132:47-850(+)